MKLFVLSDVHSFYEPMMAALEKNGFDINNSDHHIVVCGDLFDRGPDANKVFAFAKRMADEGRLNYVCGNHEDLLFDCVREIYGRRGVSSHHVSNGTLDTLVQITGFNKYDLYGRTCDIKEFSSKIEPLLDFIADNAVNYIEAGDYVFVHGWVPAYEGIDSLDEATDEDWEQARWENGMAMWKNKKCRLPGKTVVCGHWHSSWGHSHIHQDRKEFPQKNRIDWEKSFEPFIDDGIIAIDACTAYTGFCNCLVVEV